MIAFLATIVGPRFAKPAFYIALALLALSILGVVKCSADRKAVVQIEQTNRSNDALANSAVDVVETYGASVNRAEAIEAATEIAQKDVDNAQDVSAIRDSVVRSFCLRDARKAGREPSGC